MDLPQGNSERRASVFGARASPIGDCERSRISTPASSAENRPGFRADHDSRCAVSASPHPRNPALAPEVASRSSPRLDRSFSDRDSGDALARTTSLVDADFDAPIADASVRADARPLQLDLSSPDAPRLRPAESRPDTRRLRPARLRDQESTRREEALATVLRARRAPASEGTSTPTTRRQ